MLGESVMQWVEIVLQAGAVGVLLILVWAFIHEGLVGGDRHRKDLEAAEARTKAVREESEFWRDIALRSLGAGEVAVNLLKQEAELASELAEELNPDGADER